MSIELWQGAVIRLVGLDKPERIEGGFWDGGGITEYGNCQPKLLFDNILPMMTRPGAWIVVEGTPEGQNHYWKLYEEIRGAVERGDKNKLIGAETYTWTTEETIYLWMPKEDADRQIARWRATMDDRTYRQEIRGEFVGGEGQAYYAFDENKNCPPRGLDFYVNYDPKVDLVMCLDFNRSPGVALMLQEQQASNFPWVKRPALNEELERFTLTAVVAELWIEKDATTPDICRAFLDRFKEHKGTLLVYGDPSGRSKTTQSTEGSDWELVRQSLRPIFKDRLRIMVDRVQPGVRDRINSLNARLVAVDGGIGTVISRDCVKFMRDLKDVSEDAKGQLVKPNDTAKVGGDLTHISDAFGYYTYAKYPLGGDDMSVEY